MFPLVIGHRGSRRLAVENTIESLRIAIDQGAHGVEFDVQLSADGELLLFHDDDLRRLARRPEPLIDLTWRELRQLGLHDGDLRVQRLAHLDEVLELVDRHPIQVNAELKVNAHDLSGGLRLADAMLKRLRDLHLPRWLFSSFQLAPVQRLAEGRADLRLAALIDEAPPCDWWPLTSGEMAMPVPLFAVNPAHALVNLERMERWQLAGREVWPWTVNHPRDWERLCELGVHALITDTPDALLHFLARNGKR